MAFINSDSWTILSNIEQDIKRKIDTIGIPLRNWDVSINYGIKTGFNDAFIISGTKKDELINADPNSAEIIRPILRGRDIKRYGYTFADLWIISTFPSRNYDINEFPAVRDYLLSFGLERLEQSGKKHIVDGKEVKARKKTNNKWFETQDSISYWDDFNKQKICWIELTDESKFSFSDDGIYLLNTVFFMVGEQIKYLLAVLNSKLIHWYFTTCTGTTSGVGTNRWLKYTVETIPVPRALPDAVEEIMLYVDSLLAAKKDGVDTLSIENTLDRLVLNVYGLSEEEQAFILNQN